MQRDRINVFHKFAQKRSLVPGVLKSHLYLQVDEHRIFERNVINASEQKRLFDGACSDAGLRNSGRLHFSTASSKLHDIITFVFHMAPQACYQTGQDLRPVLSQKFLYDLIFRNIKAFEDANNISISIYGATTEEDDEMDIDGGLRKRRRECVFINDELEDMKITKEFLRSYV